MIDRKKNKSREKEKKEERRIRRIKKKKKKPAIFDKPKSVILTVASSISGEERRIFCGFKSL